MLCIRGDKQEADYLITIYEGKYSSRVALCKPCYELYKPSVPHQHVKCLIAELVLSTEDWHRILRRYGLPEDISDLRILVGYERKGSVLFLGIYVAGAYRVLFTDKEQLILLDTVRDDAYMRGCCAHLAVCMSATLVE